MTGRSSLLSRVRRGLGGGPGGRRAHGGDAAGGNGAARTGERVGGRLVAYASLVVTAGVVLAAVGAFFAARLTIDSDFANLIPADYESVQALFRLRDTVGGESEAAVVIESPSFDANRRFAEDLIPRVLDARAPDGEPFFTRVDYRRDVRFLEENALYLATDAELDSIELFLSDQIRSARLEANPFYFELEDDGASAESDGAAEGLRRAYDQLVGREYPISPDSTTMMLRFYPGGAQTDIDFIEAAYGALQQAVDDLGPAAYDDGMEVVLAGRLLRQLIEVRAITDDVRDSFGVGALCVLLIVTCYFAFKSYRARAGRRLSLRLVLAEVARAPATAAVIGLPLVAALCWTFGTAYLVFGSLNLMTSTLGLVLFGLGIDYGIHFYGRYSEERGLGLSVGEAVDLTLASTGKAVAVTAVTTAASFFVLSVADFRGFSEFGFIAGAGIMYALAAMVIVLPALVVLFERLRLLDLNRSAAAPRPTPVPRGGRFPGARGIVFGGVVCLIVSIGLLPRVSFEYDFGKLDPVYEQYQKLQDRVRRVDDDRGRRNPAYVVVDDPDAVQAVEDALARHAASDSLTPTIGRVESLQRRFPQTPEAEQAKLARIADIRAMLDDPFLATSDDPWLDRLRRAASTEHPIPLDQVPEFVRSPFTARDGSVGRLIVIYPSVGLSDGRNSMAFADDVGTIRTPDGSTYHAASTSLVAADMLRLMQREAPVMIALTLVVVVSVKLILLRSLALTLLAMLPLAGGFLAMFGLSALFGVHLNFYNLVVLPAVLGISDDAGIHLAHRYREEGRGSILRVLRSTGEHIAMSALTTMVGFGGLVRSFYPGLRSIGILALLGIGVTLLFAVVGLPALLQWLEDRSPSEPASAAALGQTAPMAETRTTA